MGINAWIPAQPDGGRRAMGSGAGLLLIAVGAILLFALKVGSPHWLNLRVLGLIMTLVGVIGLALPRMAGASGSRIRRGVVPGQARARDETPAATQSGLNRRPGVNGDSSTLPD